jgi:pimeloyl-ACP methyl ester carboxylesterase
MIVDLQCFFKSLNNKCMSNTSSAPVPTIYKSPEAKAKIMALYDAKLKACKLPEYEEKYVDTPFGRTHVVVAGKVGLPPVVLLHGINAGAPLALEAMRSLVDKYRIYAVDTIGQATKSDENRPSVKDNSYGMWLAAVLDGLKLEGVAVIGVSYGAFLLQRLIAHAPGRVSKAIFVVPSGLVNGNGWAGMTRLMWPMMRFFMTKKDKHLVAFMDAFYITKDAHSIAFQRETLLGVKMDYRRPPVLREEEVARFGSPVYAMVAEDDVFFPGDKALERCKACFKNLKETVVLKGGKHIPDIADYPSIAAQLDKWLRD